jgi:hypothetical protein
MKDKEQLKNLPNNSRSVGNQTEGSKNYKDPVGGQDKLTPPKQSGYDEKQPK